jgi:hypothetical protein
MTDGCGPSGLRPLISPDPLGYSSAFRLMLAEARGTNDPRVRRLALQLICKRLRERHQIRSRGVVFGENC